MKGGEKPGAVWINGIRCNGSRDGAAVLGRLLGWRVSQRWMSRVIKNRMNLVIDGITVGVTVTARPEAAPSAAGPEEGETAEGEAAEGRGAPYRKPLLRFPPGETPLARGTGCGGYTR